MKIKAIITIIPILVLAFNYEKSDDIKTLYFQSLKFIKHADAPVQVNMIRTDNSSGQGRMLDQGTLFTYKNRSAKQVFISGNFSGWKPMKMFRSINGIWYYFLGDREGTRNVTYKFLVDGIWAADPLNTDRKDDGMGSYMSIVKSVKGREGRQVTYRNIDNITVEFRIYKPDASLVSLVGDFNHWNPENNLLSKGKDGIWRLQMKLFPGLYRYKYIIDGEWVPDMYNSRSGSDNTGEVCSMIEIKK